MYGRVRDDAHSSFSLSFLKKLRNCLQDLIDDIYKELSGDFRETVMSLYVKPARYDAWSMKEAIYGLGTDEKALVEVLMTRTNAQIQEMKEVGRGEGRTLSFAQNLQLGMTSYAGIYPE